MRDRYGSSWSFELLTQLTLHAMDLLPATPLLSKTGTIGTIYASLGLSVDNFLSPIAGYLGNLKCTRFRLLKCDSLSLIAATAVNVTANIPLLLLQIMACLILQYFGI